MMSFHPYGTRWPTVRRREFITSAAGLATLLAAQGRAASVGTAPIPAAIPAVDWSGKPITLAGADVKDLRARLGGGVLIAQDPEWQSARKIWNGAFDRKPALIARCRNTADVVAAVQFAHANKLLTAVRSGGHSISGQSSVDGGIMIDLSLMRGIRVDAKAKTASVDGGVLLGELDAACQAQGLVTTLGTAADTGIAGLTLGGGQGRLMRKFGLTCDNVRGLELVTADGKVLNVSAQQNPDLFWALRGGGGNFGIVTRFEYQLHALAHPVIAGSRVYALDQTATVLGAVRDMIRGSSDELCLSSGISNMPAGTSPLPGGHYPTIEFIHCGTAADAAKALAQLDKLGKPLLDDIVSKPYVKAQLGASGAAPPALPPGLGVYVRSGFLNEMPDALIGEFIRVAKAAPAWWDGIYFGWQSGAVERVAPTATAYWNRGSQFEFILSAVWTDHTQDAANVALMEKTWEPMQPYTRGYYVNTEPSATEQRLRATYGDNYSRLVAIKNRYDPDNLFRRNANIRPTGKA
ncbi:MAG TPA: FAD-binding oxidoreductase [Steroidobacteraceae bacterium]|nr:FAD-binding oxidoreductase [Steroidobacteraceae bacterium]